MFSKIIRSVTVFVVLVLPLLVQAQSNTGGSAEIKVLGDYILVPFDYKADGFAKKSHFLIDLTSPDKLSVHSSVMDALDRSLEPDDPVGLIGDGFVLQVLKKHVTRAMEKSGLLEDLSREYDEELAQIDISAIAGLGLFEELALGINVAEKTVRFSPASNVSLNQAKSRFQYVFPGLKLADDKAVLPVSNETEVMGLMWLNFGGYHSSINEPLTAVFKNKHKVKLTSGKTKLALSDMVAIRPVKELPLDVGKNNIVMITGLGLWSAYEVEMNLTSGYLALSPTQNHNFSEADQAFYTASYTESEKSLLTFMQQYPDSRNVSEALAEVFEMVRRDPSRLNPKQSAEMFDYVLAQMENRRKALFITDYCDEALNARDAVAIAEHAKAICKKALDYVHLAQEPSLRQNIQMGLGDVAMEQDQYRDAWKFYLAAAFQGDPRLDFDVRVSLANAYAAMKRYRRAYSTYKRLRAEYPQQAERAELTEKMAVLAQHLAPNDRLLETN